MNLTKSSLKSSSRSMRRSPSSPRRTSLWTSARCLISAGMTPIPNLTWTAPTSQITAMLSVCPPSLTTFKEDHTMSTIDTFTPVNQPEYHNHFWNYLMGKEGHEPFLDLGRKVTGAYAMPTTSSKKFEDKLKAESLFRQLATVHYAPNGPSTILARVNTDSAEWVGPGGAISAYDAINDFSTYKLNDHKLAVIMQLDASFLHDNRYIFESYVTTDWSRISPTQRSVASSTAPVRICPPAFWQRTAVQRSV
jgi:hypothetical protein